jgi:hypothetical protein
VSHGRCQVHTRQQEQRRGSRHQRGYGVHWDAFRPAFISLLVAHGIVPVCGAALSTGPQTHDSLCKADGLLTFTNPDGSSLHFDHHPPLTDAERADPAIVCDPTRIQLLCGPRCHQAKTLRERQVGGSRNV